MSAATYLAWNGQSYPWPPPEGWYEAADGRWWAPGSGPDPAPTSAPATATTTADTAVSDPLQSVDGSTPWADQQPFGDSTTPPAADANPVDGSAVPPSEQSSLLFDDPRSPEVAEPAWSPPDSTGSILSGRTTQMPSPEVGMDRLGGPAGSRSAANPAAEHVHGLQDGRSGIPVDPLPGHGSGPAVWQSTPPPVEHENRTPLFIAAGVAGVLVIAALAVIGLTRGDQQDAGSALPTSDGDRDPTTAGTADDATTTPGDQQPTSAQPGDGDGEDSRPGSSGADSTTADSPATTATVTSTAAAEATTAAAPTTSTNLASIDTLTDAEKVREFRAVLQTNGLSSDQLTDEELIEFGTSFCIFAIAADGFEQYVDFREEAIGQSESQLTGDELTLAVDAAIQVFCPDEALRLGIG